MTNKNCTGMPIIGDKQGMRGISNQRAAIRDACSKPAQTPLGSAKITPSCVLSCLQRNSLYNLSHIPEIQFWPAVSEPQWGTVAAPCGLLQLQWRTDKICTQLPGPDRWWSKGPLWGGGNTSMWLVLQRWLAFQAKQLTWLIYTYHACQ